MIRDSGVKDVRGFLIVLGDVVDCKVEQSAMSSIGFSMSDMEVFFDKGCFCVKPEVTTANGTVEGFIPLYQLSYIRILDWNA